MRAEELFEQHFEDQVLATVEDHPDAGEWSVAGRAKKVPEDLNWWRKNGPEMVANWIRWRQGSGWRPWRTPDGELALELDIVVDIGGLDLKMFVDSVMVSRPGNQLVIVDFKTGSRTPESDLQLGVYRYGIRKKYGVDIKLGTYWMARKGDMGEVFDLTRFTPELVELWFHRFVKAKDAGIFIPHPTSKCRACSMRDYCTAFGGAKQNLDPDYGGASDN